MEDLSKGLLFAHNHNIFHHDVNYKNSFTCKGKDKNVVYKLGDWGGSILLKKKLGEFEYEATL